MTLQEKLHEATKKTVDYLYKIDGDCSPELYEAIAILRQLINEEFVPKRKSVSSQMIFDVLNPKLTALFNKHTLEVIEGAKPKAPTSVLPDGEVSHQTYNDGKRDAIDDYHTRLLKLMGEE